MKYRKGISLIAFFFIIIGLMVVVYSFTFFSGKDGLKIVVDNLSYFTPLKSLLKQTPAIVDFKVEANNFVVKGRSLSKVEIWYMLNVADEGKIINQKISETKDYKVFFLKQKFVNKIGCGPFSPVSVYVKAYDENGVLVQGEIELDQTKYKEFYNISCPKDATLDLRDGFFVVDAETGLNISKVDFFINGKNISGTTNLVDYAKTLPVGVYKLAASSIGYKDVKNIGFYVPGSLNNVVINMIPVNTKTVAPKLVKDKLRISGYVTDEIHNPVQDVVVNLENYNIKVKTDANGFYYMDIAPQSADLCTSNTMTYFKDGYKKQTISNFGSGSIKTGFEGTEIKSSITLVLGSGEEISDQKYHMCP